MGLLAVVLFLPGLMSDGEAESVSYDVFLGRVAAGEVATVAIDNQTGRIDFETVDGAEFGLSLIHI